MNHLPDNTGYVAAAYLVFLALLLIYFSIMATRSSRLERQLQELNRLADRDRGTSEPEPAGADA